MDILEGKEVNINRWWSWMYLCCIILAFCWPGLLFCLPWVWVLCVGIVKLLLLPFAMALDTVTDLWRRVFPPAEDNAGALPGSRCGQGRFGGGGGGTCPGLGRETGEQGFG